MAARWSISASAVWRAVVLSAIRVYVFVAGLVGLVVRRCARWSIVTSGICRSRRSSGSIRLSAVVDNAALTAAEIGPAVSRAQQRAILMGLLISGGMLIPGNIPNIVAAHRLRIGSREWARVGLTVGLALMLLCFAVLDFLG